MNARHEPITSSRQVDDMHRFMEILDLCFMEVKGSALSKVNQAILLKELTDVKSRCKEYFKSAGFKKNLLAELEGIYLDIVKLTTHTSPSPEDIQ